MIERWANPGNPLNHLALFHQGSKLLSQCSRFEVRQSGRLRHHLPQQLNTLTPLLFPNIYSGPGDIAARPRQARHNSSLNRKGEGSDDGNCGGRRLEVEDDAIAYCNDHIRIAAHDITSQVWRGSSFARISLNQKILPLHISHATQFVKNRLPKRLVVRLGNFAYRLGRKNDGNARSFSKRSERPCRRCATNERDELATPHGFPSFSSHSITLSARANKASGTVTPIALAVLRLITSSNFVGCSTGRSAGIVPRKRLAANRAVRSAK